MSGMVLQSRVAVGVELALWRDPSPSARRLPGMAMGTVEINQDWVAEAVRLYRDGVRAVTLGRPVALCGPEAEESAGAVALIRELTAHGISVEWTATCRPGCDDDLVFGHLWPPATVDGAADPDAVAREWRRRFFPAKCVFRRGPGFLEVRDRRWGSLELFTIEEPAWIDAVAAMVEGAPVETVPQAAREAFADARLTVTRAGRLWWLPARVRRWPFPPLLV